MKGHWALIGVKAVNGRFIGLMAGDLFTACLGQKPHYGGKFVLRWYD